MILILKELWHRCFKRVFKKKMRKRRKQLSSVSKMEHMALLWQSPLLYLLRMLATWRLGTVNIHLEKNIWKHVSLSVNNQGKILKTAVGHIIKIRSHIISAREFAQRKKISRILITFQLPKSLENVQHEDWLIMCPFDLKM